MTRNTIRETNISKARKRRRDNEQKSSPAAHCRVPGAVDSAANGDLPPVQKTGAAVALQRLETAEERAHARLEAALKSGDAVQIAACQDFG